MDLESAAAVLGVHYQTAYRWVRTGLLDAVKVGLTYELDPDHVAMVAEERRQDRRSRPGGEPNCGEAAAALSGCLASGDDAGARRLVEQLQREGLNLTALCDRVIAPAMGWLHDEWTVGLASAGEIVVAADICERLVGLLASPPRGRPRGLALVASLEGERHRLPGLMATVALRAERWRVHHLGCGTPAEDLADFVLAEQPDLLVLSVATSGPAAEAVRTMTGDAVPVLVGTPGATLAEMTAAAKSLCTTRRNRSGGATTQPHVPSFAPAG